MHWTKKYVRLFYFEDSQCLSHIFLRFYSAALTVQTQSFIVLVIFAHFLCRFTQSLLLTLAIFCSLDCSKCNENSAHRTTNNICCQQMNAAQNHSWTNAKHCFEFFFGLTLSFSQSFFFLVHFSSF